MSDGEFVAAPPSLSHPVIATAWSVETASTISIRNILNRWHRAGVLTSAQPKSFEMNAAEQRVGVFRSSVQRGSREPARQWTDSELDAMTARGADDVPRNLYRIAHSYRPAKGPDRVFVFYGSIAIDFCGSQVTQEQGAGAPLGELAGRKGANRYIPFANTSASPGSAGSNKAYSAFMSRRSITLGLCVRQTWGSSC